jgi:hypothetical protein
MNSVADENGFSGQKAPPDAGTGALSAADKALQRSDAPVRLEISWHVAPAQNVAILDSTGMTGVDGFPPLAATGPVAAGVPPLPRECKCL